MSTSGPRPDGRAGPTRTALGARGERTKERLLVAARIAFRGAGWNRARVEDICRQAGVGHGTFYAYFANKTEILEALVRRHAESLYQVVDAPWTGVDVRADVRRVVAGVVDTTDRDRDVREIWYAAAPHEPALGALVDEVSRQLGSRIGRALYLCGAAGLVHPRLDVEVTSVALQVMVEQTARLAQDQLPGVPRERLVDGMTDVWLHAVYR